MRSRRPLFIVLYVLIASLLVSASLEAVLRMGYFAPTFEQPGLRYGLKIMLDRKVLFRIKPKSRVDINNMGYRDRDFTIQKGDRKRVLFLGDSYAIGLNTQSRYTIPKALERMLDGPHGGGGGYEVMNMGVHGYGPDQSLIQLMQEGLSLNPDMVVLALYPANDFNDLIKNRLFKLGPSGALTRNRPNAVTAKLPPLELLYLAQYALYKHNIIEADYEELFVTLFDDGEEPAHVQANATPAAAVGAVDPDAPVGATAAAVGAVKTRPVGALRLMEAVLGEFKKVLDDNKIDFLAVIIPSFIEVDRWLKKEGKQGGYFRDEEAAAWLCEKLSIPYISLHPLMLEHERPLSLYDRTDNHLNVKGNSLAARAVVKYITDLQTAQSTE